MRPSGPIFRESERPSWTSTNRDAAPLAFLFELTQFAKLFREIGSNDQTSIRHSLRPTTTLTASIFLGNFGTLASLIFPSNHSREIGNQFSRTFAVFRETVPSSTKRTRR